jgi:hypothetical protein
MKAAKSIRMSFVCPFRFHHFVKRSGRTAARSVASVVSLVVMIENANENGDCPNRILATKSSGGVYNRGLLGIVESEASSG